MLYEIMRHVRNFFPAKHAEGTYEIKDGMISLPFVLEDQYFLIEGSILNDGLYKYPVNNLNDEKFNGVITALAIPKAFLELADEIKEYCTKYPATPYMSESFGGYSYTMASKGGANGSGGPISWKEAYSARLAEWRKV